MVKKSIKWSNQQTGSHYISAFCVVARVCVHLTRVALINMYYFKPIKHKNKITSITLT